MRWIPRLFLAFGLLLACASGALAQNNNPSQCALPINVKTVTTSTYKLSTSDRCWMIIITSSGTVNIQLPAPGLIFSPSYNTTILPLAGATLNFTNLADDAGLFHKINLASSLTLTSGSGAILQIQQDMNWYAQPIASATGVSNISTTGPVTVNNTTTCTSGSCNIGITIPTADLLGGAANAFTTVSVGAQLLLSGGTLSAPLATSSTFGTDKPDNTTITISAGTLTAATATSSTLGIVEPDNTTVTISGGILSATGAAVPACGATTIARTDCIETFTAQQTFHSVLGSLGNNGSPISGTTYTIDHTKDCGTLLVFTSSAGVTLTTDANAPIQCNIAVEQQGTGTVTIADGSGATHTSASGLSATNGQYVMVGLTVDANSGGTAANYDIYGISASTGIVNAGTTGQIAQYPSNGTTVQGATVSGDATIAAGGALTVASIGGKAVSLGGALTTAGVFTTTGGPTTLAFPAGAATFTFPGSGKTLLATDLSNIGSSILSPTNGGTGVNNGINTLTLNAAATSLPAAPGSTQCLQEDSTGAITPTGSTCGSGSGSVTSVGLSVPAASIFGVSGSPVTTSGTLGLTTTGTSGGVPFFSGSSTIGSSGTLSSNMVVLGGGIGNPPTTFTSTSNGIAYFGAAGAFDETNALPNATLVTDGTGIPSISTTLPSALTIPSPALTVTPTAPTATAGTNTTQVATTAFVQAAVTASNPAIAVQAATTAAGDTSGLTYNNGVSGIGATFTGTVNTALTVDGYTFTALGQRLLVKNDTQSPSGAFNGVYYVTQVQTVGLPPVLTRALDYDQPSDINNTGAIPVVNGTVNASTSWLLTSAVATVGTDPLTYSQFTRSLSAAANTVTGNFTSGTANVANNAMPSCSDSGGNHLNYVSGTGITCGTSGPAVPAGANPTATIGTSAVNGSATTFMRSDGAPAIPQCSSSTFGACKVDNSTITASSGVISAALPVGANPTATAGASAVNGTATTFMRSDGAPALTAASTSTAGIAKLHNVPVSVGWVATVNPNNAVIAVINQASTISAIIGAVETATGGTATVSVNKAASGTTCSAGTTLHSGSFNANGTAATNQTLTVTTSSLAAGDRLCLQTTGTTSWTTGTGIGTITVFLAPS